MTILFTLVFIFGMAIGLTVGIFIHPVYGQTPTQVVTVPNPQSGLNFLPQKAYVTTLTPEGIPIQLQPVQQQPQQSSDSTLISIITSTILSLGGAAGLKLHSDRKTDDKVAVVDNKVVKVADVTLDNSAEILKGKTVDKELAKVAFNANPVEAEKITDAPLIKLQTLAADESTFATKTAKTSLPTDDE